MGRPRKVRGPCTVNGCDQAERSNGLCRHHYMKAWRKAHAKKHEADPSSWDAEAVAWVAGQLDARGSFRFRVKGRERHFRVQLRTFGRDVAQRMLDVLGVGSVGLTAYQGKYSWSVGCQQHIRALCGAIRPWMSELRRGQIDRLLAAMPEPCPA